MKGIGNDDEFWAALAQGDLKMQQCSGCGQWNWPAVWRCGACGSWDHAWHKVSGKGRIYSWTRSWHDFGGPRDLPIPYVSVVVELDDAGGNRLLGILQGGDPAIGAPVQMVEVRKTEFEGEPLLSLVWGEAP